MENPFYQTNASFISNENLLSIRVDRDSELTRLIQAVVEKRHNVLLFGERGIGKSFLLRLIQNELKSKKEILAPIVRISSLQAFGGEDPVASFSRLMLLQVCTSIWKDVLNMDFLDLRESLDEGDKDIKLRNSAAKTTNRVYRQLMTTNRVVKYQTLNTVGFSAVVKGGKEEQISHQKEQADILPFEFTEFAQSLIEKVLQPNGIKHTIILCDEANMFSSFFQEDILERYFGLFSDQQFQFIFVAGLAPWFNTPIPDCFQTIFELQGFPSAADLLELISKINSTNVTFSEDSITLLFKRFKGHPRSSIAVCQQAFEIVQESREAVVSLKHIEEASNTVEEGIRKLEEDMKKTEFINHE